MGITLPQADWIGQEVFRKQEACAPAEGEQVERAELARLIELAVLGFGEVLLPVDFIQHILLDNGMHDDGHQHVEEGGGQVLDAMVEVVHGCLL